MSGFDGSQEAIAASVNESIGILTDAWRTEANAPEILPYQEELVEEMQELLKNQQVLSYFFH